MATWIRRDQEDIDKYTFSGKFLITENVKRTLPAIEIIGIYHDIQRLVKEKGGINSIQVYNDEQGRTIHFIDQSNPLFIRNKKWGMEENLCVLHFAHEY
jgi:hypothetical protein